MSSAILDYAIGRLEAERRNTPSKERRSALGEALEIMRAMRATIADEQKKKLD